MGPYGRSAPTPQPPEPDAKTLLERFGLVTEEGFAALLGISVKTLRNRSRFHLPAYVKAGRRRLYVEESVRQFLKQRQVDPLFLVALDRGGLASLRILGSCGLRVARQGGGVRSNPGEWSLAKAMSARGRPSI
jgi:Helix-turn-helix domain